MRHAGEKAVLVILEGYTVFHHSFFHAQHLLVRTSDGVPLRVVTDVEPFGDILRYVLVEVLRLDSVTEGVGVRKSSRARSPYFGLTYP